MDPTPVQWFLRSVAFLAALFALAVGAAFLFGGVSDEEALIRSVERDGNALDVICSGGEGERRCLLFRTSDEIARYLIKTDGDCWSARRRQLRFDDAPLPKRLEGCIVVRDRYPFVDKAFTAWELGTSGDD